MSAMDKEGVEKMAEHAYRCYAKSTSGKTFDGRPMPKWHELPERIKDAWFEATVGVIESMLPFAIKAGHDTFKALLAGHADKLAKEGDANAEHFAALAKAESEVVVDTSGAAEREYYGDEGGMGMTTTDGVTVKTTEGV